jgi:hypothetical protein
MTWGKAIKGGWPRTAETTAAVLRHILYTVLEVVPGGVIRGGKKAADDFEHAGFWLGIDPGDGLAKFHVGGSSYYFYFTGSTIRIRVDGSEIFNIDGANLATGSVSLQALVRGITANLIANGSFEDGVLAPHTTGPGGGTWRVVTSPTHGGAYALEFDPDGQSDDAVLHLNASPTNLRSHPDLPYPTAGVPMQFYLRRGGAGTSWNAVELQLRWYAADGTLLETAALGHGSGLSADTWHLVGGTPDDVKTPPADARTAVFVLVVKNDGGDGKLYVDDLYAAWSTNGAWIAESSITALALGTGSVEAPAIASGAVQTSKLADGAVTAAKLGTLAGYVELAEISNPAAPSSNRARLYACDNGSGKTELVVRFATGAVQVLAVEP